jgi:hypothetical protein
LNLKSLLLTLKFSTTNVLLSFDECNEAVHL